MASQIIKSRLKRGGRAVFFVLLLIQCGFLTAYPVYYKGPEWSPVFISYAPVCLIWLYSLYKRATELRTFFVVWAFYIVCALLTNVIVIFGFVVESIDKEKFLCPNVLKVVLCITPVLLVLLMVTADNGEETDRQKEVRRELVAKLCTQMAIDLLDTIEVLDIILEDAEHDDRIKLKGFGTTMTAVACLSFVLTLVQMTEIKFNNDGKPEKTRYTTTLLRTAAEMVFVNFIFLIARLVAFFSYGKDESIFIAKNGLAILLSALQIYYLYDPQRRWNCC
ncbi:uncharacterized protein [Montipora foliosa]|uniref:uncharacterized protein n=1 Tax=Montipora foliosa TaxID=591990 RepID=UPI0035F10570